MAERTDPLGQAVEDKGLGGFLDALTPDFFRGTSPAQQAIRGGDLLGGIAKGIGEIGQTTLEFLPGVGDVLDASTFAFGKDPLSGHSVSGLTRGAAGLAALGLGSAAGLRAYQLQKAGKLGDRLRDPRGSLALIPGRGDELTRRPRVGRELEVDRLGFRTRNMLRAENPRQLTLSIVKGEKGRPLTDERIAIAEGLVSHIGHLMVESDPRHARILDLVDDPDAGIATAAGWELAKLESAARLGMLKTVPEFQKLWDRLVKRPDLLNAEQTSKLTEFAMNFARATSGVPDVELRIHPDIRIDGFTESLSPDGGLVPILRWRTAADKLAKLDLNSRVNNLDFRAPQVYEAGKNHIRTAFSLAMPDEIDFGLRWYRQAFGEALEAADEFGVDGDQFLGVVAVLSPSLEWSKNIEMAKRVTRLIREGRYKTEAEWKRHYGEGRGKTRAKEVVPEDRLENVSFNEYQKSRKLLAGDASPLEVLFGDLDSSNWFQALKTRNFFLNLSEPELWHPATIDRHALAIFLGYSPSLRDNPLQRRGSYMAVSDAYREVAAEMGLKAQELQAITWVAWRRLKGETNFPGETVRRPVGEPTLGSETKRLIEGTSDAASPATLVRQVSDGTGFAVDPDAPVFKGIFKQDVAGAPLGMGLFPDGTLHAVAPVDPVVKDVTRTLHPAVMPGDPGLAQWVTNRARYVEDLSERRAELHRAATVNDLPAFSTFRTHADLSRALPAEEPGTHLIVEGLTPGDHGVLRQALADMPGIEFDELDYVTHTPARRFDRTPPKLDTPDDLRRALDERSWIAVSSKVDGQPFDPKKQARLERDIRKAGYEPIAVMGEYDGPEPSFLVFGMSPAEGIDLGRRYDQQSVAGPDGVYFSDAEGGIARWVGETDVDETASRLDEFYTELELGRRKVRFSLPPNMDAEFNFIREPLPDPNASVTELRPEQTKALRIRLGDAPDPVTVKQAWDSVVGHGKEHGVQPRLSLYAHGPAWVPEGTTRLWEYVDADRTGYLTHRAAGDPDLTAPNAYPVWVSADEAAAYADAPNPRQANQQHEARTTGNQAGSARGDAVVNGEVKLLFAHLLEEGADPDITFARNPLATRIGGRQYRNYAVWAPDSDMPAVAFGANADEAVQALVERTGAPAEEIVRARLGRVNRDGKRRQGLLITAPPSPLDPTQPQRLLAHRARLVFARMGVDVSNDKISLRFEETA